MMGCSLYVHVLDTHVCGSWNFCLSFPFSQMPPSESDVARAHSDNAILEVAERLLEEEMDEVKHMNQMVQYAKTVAIRDKQIKVGAAGQGW